MDKNQIFVIYGTEILNMTKHILSQAKAFEGFDKNTAVMLKPNLVTAGSADNGATTHPEIAAGVIEALRENGFNDISIIEGSWIGERTSRAFKACGYEELAKRYKVKLIDTQPGPFTLISSGGYDMEISKEVLKTGLLINLPVLKGHCQTNMTCALKNLKGLISNNEKRRFHTMGLHKPIAALAAAITPALTLVDSICGDLNFEEGGNPVIQNRIILSRDPVLCDTYCAGLIGFELSDVPYIKLAEKLGAGCADISRAEVIELNRPENTVRHKNTRKAGSFTRYITEDGACSACYAGLINALDRLSGEGLLHNNLKFSIGQGFIDKDGEEIGVGSCCRNFAKHIPGCPAKGIDIVRYIKN